MKLLIIGSEGFIGKHCSRFFSEEGSLVYKADVIEKEEEYYTCINKLSCSFDELFRKHQYDICINASGSAHVGFSFDKPDIDFELNVVNVHKLLVAIHTYNPKCKFINFSSAAVYGNPQVLPVTEEQQKNPLSPYGFHKLQSEYLLKEYHRFFGISTCNLRIFSAYGPGLQKQLFWDLFRKYRQNATTISLFGSGNETRDFIYIEDLLKALQCIIDNASFDGESYNIASGIETRISEAANVFFKHLDPKVQISFSGEQKLGDPDNWVADISKLKQLGFYPTFSIDRGLKETTDWLRNVTE
jgi:UDP-glucose 4-epimerase